MILKIKRFATIIFSFAMTISLIACEMPGRSTKSSASIEELEEITEDDFIGIWHCADDTDDIWLEFYEGGEGIYTLNGHETDISWKLRDDGMSFKLNGSKYTVKSRGKNSLKVTDPDGNKASYSRENEKDSALKKTENPSKKGLLSEKYQRGLSGKGNKGNDPEKDGIYYDFPCGTFAGVFIKDAADPDSAEYYDLSSFELRVDKDMTGLFIIEGQSYDVSVEFDGENVAVYFTGYSNVLNGYMDENALHLLDIYEDSVTEYLFALPDVDPSTLLPDSVKDPGNDQPSTVSLDLVGEFYFFEMNVDDMAYTWEDLGDINYSIVFNSDGTGYINMDGEYDYFDYTFDYDTLQGAIYVDNEKIEIYALEIDGGLTVTLLEDDDYIVYYRQS